jgi:outer membrane protein, heavy metal efflux system
MRHFTQKTQLVLSLVFLQFLAGCAAERVSPLPPAVASFKADDVRGKPPEIVEQPSKLSAQLATDGHQGIVQTSAHARAQSEPVVDLFGGDKTLTTATLVRVVLERSPTLDQMRATAAAVQARYPQAVSLDDPMLSFETAPGSISAQNASYAARTELSQKLPFFGKRALRGEVVQAEASAAERDVEDVRLILIQSALNAYADYYLAEQALVVNADNLKIIQDFRMNAETRYKNGQVSQQDLLQADVEIARQQERTVYLERARQVAKARLNTLMHLPPDAPLPPPAHSAPVTQTPEAAALRAMAIAARPDLKALAARVVAEEAAVELAIREFKPDVELMASYDSFWQGANGHPLQWQVGAKINLPVRLERREAAVAEARAKVAQKRAELSRLTDQVNLQVQESYEMLHESGKVIQLYDKKLLPAADANIKEAQSSYVNGKIPFVALIEAQRSLIGLKDRYYEALSEAVRRRAALERAVGGTIDVSKN